jgi:TPR repeat protein
MANQVAAIIALFLAIFIPASGASAGSPEDGITAALRGNYAAAIRLWRPLAEDGDVQAQYAIGTMYELGLGVTQNREEAVKWYRRAANLGFADAEYSLAESYENGRRVPRDYEEAANWYRRAAEHGHRLAPENLGIMYLFGSGVAKDHVFASMWFIIAELKGNKAAAQNRKSAEGNMTPAEILGAENLAREWLAKFLFHEGG